jgi:tripartite-type tricarboxylate transporter receptor subunit TctC
MVSAGNGSISHALGELFKMMTEVDICHVSRRSGTHGLVDLLAEQAQVMFFALQALWNISRLASCVRWR